ncbi:unnamed protein product, partial [marine sediment metagenome]
NTDLSVSRLAYGTWQLGGAWDKNPPADDVKQRALRLLQTAVDCGINHTDWYTLLETTRGEPVP